MVELQNFDAAREMIKNITGYERQKRVLQKYLDLASTLQEQQQIFDFFDFLFANEMQNDVALYARYFVPYVKDKAVLYAKLARKFQEKEQHSQALSWIHNALRIEPDNSNFKELKHQILQMRD